MNDNLIYTESQDGLSAFFTKIYSLVGVGIGLSAFVSWLMLYPFQQNLITIMTEYSFVYMGAFLVELVLVFLASNAARKNTPAALPLFLTYSALNGFTLSFNGCSNSCHNKENKSWTHKGLKHSCLGILRNNKA